MTESQHDPGAALKAAREAINVSPREIADALNLPVHVVEAIENYDTDNLPAAVFTRGYIRAYAKLLELDPEPIVVGYEFDEPIPKPVPEGRFEKVKPVFNRTQLLALVSGVILVLVLLIVLVVWLWPETIDPVGDPPVSTQTNEAPVTLTEFGSEDESDDGPGVSSAQRQELARETAPTVLEDPIAEPLVIAEALVESANGRRITEFGDDEMWFQFTEDCWVEIKDTQGANLYSDLSRSGQNLRLVGQGPFRILLGYAPGVQMQYNGETVSLLAHTRNNVASLVLGQ